MDGNWIPLSAIVLGIGLAAWSTYLDHQRKRLQYQERQLLIEKGLTPPPLQPEERRRRRPEDALQRGIVLLSLGIGLTVGSPLAARFVDGDLGGVMAVAAAIVGFLGAGNLVFYFIARKKSPDDSMPPAMPM